MTDKYLRIKDIAEYFSVSDDTVRNWAKTRDFPLKKVGGVNRALQSEIKSWVEKQEKFHKDKQSRNNKNEH